MSILLNQWMKGINGLQLPDVTHLLNHFQSLLLLFNLMLDDSSVLQLAIHLLGVLAIQRHELKLVLQTRPVNPEVLLLQTMKRVHQHFVLLPLLNYP